MTSYQSQSNKSGVAGVIGEKEEAQKTPVPEKTQAGHEFGMVLGLQREIQEHLGSQATGEMSNKGDLGFPPADQASDIGLQDSDIWADQDPILNGLSDCTDAIYMGFGEEEKGGFQNAPLLDTNPLASVLEANSGNQKGNRRSPRITKRKFFGKSPKEKEEKLKLLFQSREADIDANLAIHLVKESGTEMIDEIKEMFLTAAKEGHPVLIQGETSAVGHELEVHMLRINSSDE